MGSEGKGGQTYRGAKIWAHDLTIKDTPQVEICFLKVEFDAEVSSQKRGKKVSDVTPPLSYLDDFLA